MDTQSKGRATKAARAALLRPAERGQPKLRYAPRGLRYLQRWSEGFAGKFPSAEELAENPRYWNYKIPVDSGLVEAPYTNPQLQRECAQRMINACAHLIEAKPAGLAHVRVTCSISLPLMFGSELCLYLDEDYYRGHTEPGPYDHGRLRALQPRSLAREWSLILPPGVGEWGVAAEYPAVEGYDEWYSDIWYFGEVGARP
ncbi:DUF3916 domain-containing protein [Stenotrophomonas sp. PS02289]|uniref:DUF3916 domain-containing protein n=1 Tax=Stenotrophomonas sp. PS02289 TaxID=2991422 RepID=UPI00249CE87C|nr:DUF3916 domain-containing protein [Stenotrophomonas sp. PS02289]